MNNNEISVEDADKLLAEAYGKAHVPEPAKEEEPAPPTPEEEVVEPSATPEVATTPEIPAKEVATDEWLKEIPDTVRGKVEERVAALAAAEQRIRSDDGRVRAFQRQAEELKQKLLEVQKPQTPAAPTAPSTPEEWQRVIEHDPVLADAIDKRVQAKFQEFKQTNIDPLAQRQLTQDEIRQSDVVARERQLLAEAIPEAFEIVKTDMFLGWLENEAPPAIAHAIRNSFDHRDHIAGLNLFATTMINTGRVTPKGDIPSQGAPSGATVIDPERAAAIAASRDRRSEATQVHTKQTPINTAPVDPKKPLTIEEAEEILMQSWKKNQKN